MSNKTKLKLIFGIIITILVLYYSFKTLGSLDLSPLIHANINGWLVFISIAVTIYSNYIRGLGYTLGIDPKINRLTALQIVGIGHAANMILPLHIGDGLRFAFFPGDYSPMRRAKLVMIPAIADSIAIILVSLLAVPFSGFKDPTIVRILWILFFACIVLSIVFLVASCCVPRLRSYMRQYLTISMLNMVLWVLLSYVLLFLATWAGLAAFGFGWGHSLRLSLAVFATTNLIGFIPASPGAVGLFEYGVIIGLAGLGIRQSDALSAGLLLHVIQYAALLPLGIVLFVLALRGKYGETVKKILHQKM
ncbi:lysylphosphatidylglycerol synthase domain-containing protein [Sporolactobacillus shoreicorticis]|uniref:Phosphatidylglycerol lysyltransferase n=1 Tax=Sporolactobacillus shoreicorticis TaxID=1923877 RepID=A0ABW5S3Y4_9BACL|nr:lysylphosphatidylglycerol synthase domain-containing protein [Sporolactobacillus shoreicorticis]MCO7124360.1 lysylphosphatidylglycerol synthase domain-containing protein [Sporolactobacillus shoreicorticis]